MPALNFSNLNGDSPVTAWGKFSTKLTARAMELRASKPCNIIASPALRAVQTASAFAEYFDIPISVFCRDRVSRRNIQVEPGLFEPLSWYNSTSPPQFLSIHQFVACGYPIDLS
jgi:broad specificity phosphatase PhoE